MSYYLFIAAAAALVSVYVHGVWGRRLYSGFIGNFAGTRKAVSLASWDVFTVMAVSGADMRRVNPDMKLMAYPIMLMHLAAPVFSFLIP